MSELWRRFVALIRRDALDDDFDEQAAAHLDLATDDYLRRGLPPEEARRRARLAFGSPQAAKDAHREARGVPWLEAFAFDVRLALRGLRRDWSYALASAGMLALALALNTTAFTVMDAMLFRGHPGVARSHELVFLQERDALGRCCLSYADVADWQDQARSFQGIAAVGGASIALRDDRGRVMDLRVAPVGVNLFGLLGVPPARGRDFTAADAVPGARAVLLLSDRVWRTRFGARADIVGAAVHVDGRPGEIVGVMPAGFEFPMAASGGVWTPLVAGPDVMRRGLSTGAFTAVGRLRPDVSLAEAQADLEAINRGLASAYPATNEGLVPTTADHAEVTSGADAWVIWGSLWIASCLVLLVACANVANLSLVRTVGRWRHLVTCLALGAGRARLARQLLAESALITSVAILPAWALTRWGVARWAAMAESRYQAVDYSVAATTWLYLAAAAGVAGLVVAAAPVVRLLKASDGSVPDEGRGVTQTRRTRRLIAGLVAGQMTLAAALLASAGVLVRSLTHILTSDTGVREPASVLVGMIRTPSARYPTPASRLGYFDRVGQRLSAVAGVDGVALSSGVPVKFSTGPRQLEVEGQPVARDDRRAGVAVTTATPGYFAVVGARIRVGRDFTARDGLDDVRVAIVNERFADLWWPGESAIGKRLRPVTPDGTAAWHEVVGVATNVVSGDALRQQFQPIVYVPLRQEPPARSAFFLVRTSGPAVALAADVRTAILGLDGDVELDYVDTLAGTFRFDRDFMDAEHSELGKYATAAPAFAALALLLAGCGLGAVIAHSVAQRTREIGVRIAVGATARDIRRLVIGDALRPVAGGLVGGLVAAVAVNRLIRSQLVGVSPSDPLVLIGTTALLVAVALVACRLPIRRALGVDPALVLRHE